MGLRVRKKKNQSGSISVQIVDRTNRGYKVVETLGCSDDETEIDKLHQKAILRINDLSQNLFSKSLDETSEKLLLKKTKIYRKEKKFKFFCLLKKQSF